MDQENDTNKYISLMEASKFCKYSQEYLSLRARQGKLKAVKFGRNWVTTKEWLEEYIDKVEDFKSAIYAKKEAVYPPYRIAPPEVLEKEKKVKPAIPREKFIPTPPENLPIEKWWWPVSPSWFKLRLVFREFFKIYQPRLVFITTLALVLLVAGIFYGSGSAKNLFLDLSPKVAQISQGIEKGVVGGWEKTLKDVDKIRDLVIGDVSQSFKVVKEGTIGAVKEFGGFWRVGMVKVIGGVRELSQTRGFTIKVVSVVLGDASNSFREFSKWVNQSIKTVFTKGYKNFKERTGSFLPRLKEGAELFGQGTKIVLKQLGQGVKNLNQTAKKMYVSLYTFLEEKISQGFKAITQLFKKKEKVEEEKFVPELIQEALVVVPSTEKDEETKERIKKSFSDEVKVEIKDETSGIITPVFKEREGDQYLYILVPVSEN